MDPKWWYRAGLALAIVAFIIVIARMSILAFKPEAARLERAEASALGKSPPNPPPPAAAR